MSIKDVSPEILAGIHALIVKATDARRPSFGPHNGNPQLYFDTGRRYARVFTEEFPCQRSVYCFVDLANGDILKAAGWKAPAPGKRGKRGSVLDLDSMAFDAHGGCFYRR